MAVLTQAMPSAARHLGVEIRTEAEVGKIIVRDGNAVGVALKSGEEFYANKVASGVDPHLTFEKFLEPKEMPADFLAAIQRIRYDSASMKINVALSEPPNFTAL